MVTPEGIAAGAQAISAVGGFFGSDGYSDYDHMKQRRRDLQWDRKAAKMLPMATRKGLEAAGYNPLLYANLGNNVPQHGYTPTVSSSKLDGLVAFSDTLLGIEQLKIQQTELEQENQRLEMLNRDIKLGVPNGGIYQRGTNEGTSQSTGGDIRRNTYNDGGSDLSAGVGGLFRVDVEQDPNFSNVEDYETRYGDIVGALIGLPVLGADFGRTVYKNVSPYVREQILKRRKWRADRFEKYQRENYDKILSDLEFEEQAYKLQSQNPYYRP